MHAAEPVRKAYDIPPAPSRAAQPPAPATVPPESKKLIVGRDISLNGRISSCDRLVVEGQVEAELHDCHTIEIARTGTFKGAAEIEGAEVSGLYEGSLTVRERLLIRSTGHVSGTIRYGRLEVEQGGEINGDVKSLQSQAGKTQIREVATAASASVSD
jgi:cytoskeletal protein CcmA (bactofilin family)